MLLAGSLLLLASKLRQVFVPVAGVFLVYDGYLLLFSLLLLELLVLPAFLRFLSNLLLLVVLQLLAFLLLMVFLLLLASLPDPGVPILAGGFTDWTVR
jgi:hypothetical protein